MAPKSKKTATPNTQKKGGKAKIRRKRQPLPQLHNSHSEALGLNDEEPHLHDVVKMLEDITTGLANTSTRVNGLTAHQVTLGATPDVQPGPSCVTAEGGPLLPPSMDMTSSTVWRSMSSSGSPNASMQHSQLTCALLMMIQKGNRIHPLHPGRNTKALLIN